MLDIRDITTESGKTPLQPDARALVVLEVDGDVDLQFERNGRSFKAVQGFTLCVNDPIKRLYVSSPDGAGAFVKLGFTNSAHVDLEPGAKEPAETAGPAEEFIGSAQQDVTPTTLTLEKEYKYIRLVCYSPGGAQGGGPEPLHLTLAATGGGLASKRLLGSAYMMRDDYSRFDAGYFVAPPNGRDLEISDDAGNSAVTYRVYGVPLDAAVGNLLHGRMVVLDGASPLFNRGDLAAANGSTLTEQLESIHPAYSYNNALLTVHREGGDAWSGNTDVVVYKQLPFGATERRVEIFRASISAQGEAFELGDILGGAAMETIEIELERTAGTTNPSTDIRALIEVDK